MKVMKPKYTVCLIFALIFTFQKSNACPVPEGNDQPVKIGLLVSTNKSASARQGAEIAIQKANRQTGKTGKSFILVVKSMEGPWGTGSKQAVDMIFDEKVVALIGSHDGRNAHLVEQAAAKTRFVFISAWSSDPTLSQAFVPWYFSVVPNDIQQANALVEEIYIKRKITNVVLVSDDGYDSKQAASNFISSSQSAGKKDPVSLIYNSSDLDFSGLAEKVDKSCAEAIILFGQSSSTSKIIGQLKLKKKNQTFFASINLLEKRDNDEENYKDFEGVTLPACGLWFNPAGLEFRQEYRRLYGTEPGAEAAYAFDAVNLIIDAVKDGRTGYNLIQEWLLKVKHEGATGLIQFDDKGNRIITNQMMMIKNGSPVIIEKQ
jgi:branched-chain amino acid transport system substrate-binding protein